MTRCCPGPRGGGGGSRIGPRVGDGDEFASLEVVDIEPVVSKPENAGEGRDARRRPVPLDRQGFGHGIDGAVARPAHAERTPQDFGRCAGEFGGVVEVADPIAEFPHGDAPGLRDLARRDVERNTGHAQGPAVRRAGHLGSDLNPANCAVGHDHAIFDIEIGLGRNAGLERNRPPLTIFRMNRVLEIVVGEGLVPVAAEIVLEDRRGVQCLGREVEFPDAEPARLGREQQARGSLFLRAEPVGDLRHQGGIMDLETFEPLALDRDIDLAREEIGQPAFRIADRRHQQTIPEHLAGLAIVENIGPHRHGGVDRGPDLRHRRGIRVGSLQEAAVAAENLVARVVAQPAESVVDKDDRVVGKPWVRDHHGHAGRPDGRGERVRAPVAARDLVDDAGRVPRIRRDARSDP